ncbi:cation:proton antiporter [Hydrogenimonas thermophila]|uniref:Transporter, CPA2 family n=1 Tax=Hydrogenimonas thermophila TaxID=223786 RepID=A0A1I5NET4_9BACT|nr:cation:proton antiporter [Hydrogenimonas thermophila]WOE69869.1 cation:proton antiporter [Hydrogenimonas thermophila]WOE72384.1 cation:proton antiporter [Hydrogenimonas thermophila]SFP20237.1 transporter, CPA2 family [Hydrogenimonas thermophila]
MQPHDFFLILLLILLSARIFAELFQKLAIPPVLGELLAGIILGPSLLGWVEPSSTIKLLAEIGIILLLFEVGIDTDINKLKQSGWNAAIIAIGGFLIPFILGAWVSYTIFNLSLVVSLFVGGTITATSIGITIRVLNDLKKRQSKEGEIVLGAAVLDDIFGVVLLAILYEFSKSNTVDLMNAGKVFIFIISFFIVAPIAAKTMALLIQKYDSHQNRPGLIPTAIFSLVLFFAWLAHQVGAPEIIGGFAAGLALSRRFFLPFGIAMHENQAFAAKIENQIRPIVYLFTPIFFVTVGLSMDLTQIAWSEPKVWVFGGIILLVSVIGKMFIPFFLHTLPMKKRLIIGLSMIPRGEVGLIFAEIGRIGNIFDNEIYAALILVIILTTLVPPFFIKMVYGKETGD